MTSFNTAANLPNDTVQAQELTLSGIDASVDIEYLKTLQLGYDQKIAVATTAYQAAKTMLAKQLTILAKRATLSKSIIIKKQLARLISSLKHRGRLIDHNYSKKISGYQIINNRIKDRIARLESPTLEIGAYMDDQLKTVPYVESLTGKRFDVILKYQSISENFDTKLANYLADKGTKIQLAFEPHKFGVDINSQPQYKLTTITNGNHDASLTRWAKEIKSFGKPVYFRPMCEMNGDWVVWGGTVNGNKPEDYIPAWRHIRNIFKQVGADNAIFVWAPNVDVSRKNALQTFATYYPGNEYVDLIGLNGYNWGTSQKTPTWTSWWRTFYEVFEPSYTVMAEKTNKPMIIPEMASAEVGGSKATWIKDAFYQIRTNFPRFKAVTWFNINKETDWRFHHSSTTLKAFKDAAWPATP